MSRVSSLSQPGEGVGVLIQPLRAAGCGVVFVARKIVLAVAVVFEMLGRAIVWSTERAATALQSVAARLRRAAGGRRQVLARWKEGEELWERFVEVMSHQLLFDPTAKPQIDAPRRVADIDAGQIPEELLLDYQNLSAAGMNHAQIMLYFFEAGALPEEICRAMTERVDIAADLDTAENTQYLVVQPRVVADISPVAGIDLYDADCGLLALFATSFEEGDEKNELAGKLQSVLNYLSKGSPPAQASQVLLTHIMAAFQRCQDDDFKRPYWRDLAAIADHCWSFCLAQCRTIYEMLMRQEPLSWQQLLEEHLADYREQLIQTISHAFGQGDVHVHNRIVHQLGKYGIRNAEGATFESLQGREFQYQQLEKAFLAAYRPAHLIEETLKLINQPASHKLGKLFADYLQPQLLWKEIFEEQEQQCAYREGSFSREYQAWLESQLYNPDYDPQVDEPLAHGLYRRQAAIFLLQRAEILFSRETMMRQRDFFLRSYAELRKVLETASAHRYAALLEHLQLREFFLEGLV